ncbi:MAG: tetratricopeptide repeat protein [Methanomassiliicoccales archaeon]|nr:tetratricopeptide repeat protein [Methanomassiliicoccales archaeon]
MSCIRCGDATEESAYLCEACAEACYQDPVFFFAPNLIGESLVERLRHQSAALIRLDPTPGGDIDRVPGQSFFDAVTDFNVKKASEKEAIGYYRIANFVLGQYGIPLYADHPKLLLTEESSKVVAAVAQKINSLSTQYPSLMLSDIFLRMGLIYWSASRSVLLRAGPVKWCREKRKYTLTKSLEYLGRIPEGNDLRSLAMKMSGLVLLDAGAYPDAEQKLSSARKSFPEDMVLVRALARAHFNLGNIDEAINLLDQAIAVSETAEVWLEKGEYLRRGQRFDEAIAAYEEAISIDRNYINAYKALIYLLRQMGKEDEAMRREADLKLAMEPGAAAKLEELLQAETMMPTEEAAVRARREPLFAPKKPTFRKEEVADPMRAANKAMNSGDFDLAVEILKAHIADKGGKDPGAVILLARAYLYNGQFDLANRTIGDLLRKEKESAAGWYWRARIENAEGKWGAAIQHLERATKILPSFVDAHAEKGLIFLANQRFQEADVAFTKAIEHDSENARAWLGRAKSVAKLDRWGAAIQYINKFLELIPDSREGWLFKAQLLLEKGKYQDAALSYAKYLGMEPGDSKAWCDRGLALQSIGLSEDAANSFKKCLELDPKNDQARKWVKQLSGGGSGG